MTLHIDLPKEVEKRLIGAAACHDLTVEDYVLTIVDPASRLPKNSGATSESFRSYLQSLAVDAENTERYPADFWTREIVSGGHD